MPSSGSSFLRFVAALVLAPVAGGVAAILVTLLFVFVLGVASEKTLDGATKVASMVAFWALLICVAYALVVGTAAFVFARVQQRTPPLGAAVIAGVLLGVIPFTVISFPRANAVFSSATFLFPALAVACSMATAWTFWRLALWPSSPPQT